jgi:DNA-binding Lrp family transcriptional regulator
VRPQELETASTDAVSEETGIPLSTIHYRLNKLRDDGVIVNDRLDLDLDEVARTDSTFVIERELDSQFPLQQYFESTLTEMIADSS